MLLANSADPANASADLPSIFAASQEQLWLEFEARMVKKAAGSKKKRVRH